MAAKITDAFFRGEKRTFHSSKDAYVWLLNCFMRAKPDVFSSESWDLMLIDTAGSARRYFAPKPDQLFTGAPHLASDPNMYVCLSNGWCANANLANPLKRKTLERFAKVSNLRRGVDWEWQPVP